MLPDHFLIHAAAYCPTDCRRFTGVMLCGRFQTVILLISLN